MGATVGAMRLPTAILAACALSIAKASYCTGGPSPNAPQNLYPISSPKLEHVSDHDSGRLYTAHHELGDTTFPVLHLWGSPYQMGIAQGTLLKKECVAMWNAFWAYLCKHVPGGEQGIQAMLQPIQTTSAPYIPKRFTDELRGLSVATGYNYTKLLWIHLFPESAGGHCSMFGAWGAATKHSYSGELLQMRALDYITADFLSEHH